MSLAPLLAALVAAPLLPRHDPDDAALKAMAARCGSQIEWLRDGEAPRETNGAFQQFAQGKQDGVKPPDRRKLLDDALARAQAEKKLVLWHAYRIQGPQMYRAPLLDEYMDEVLWSDPALVDLVNRRFVALRTQVPRDLGK